MLADAQAQRLTEIDTINGAVVRAAAGLGLDTPLNRAMVDLVHAMEAAWTR
jgi:2-dehydropantoate 2-reductase